MKEYRVEGRPSNDNRWWTIGDFYTNIEEAKKKIEQEKSYDELYSTRGWEYKILVREISNWEVYTEGM